MTALHFHALALIAFATGVGIFLGPAGADGDPPTPRQFTQHVLFGLAGLVVSFFLVVHGHFFWMFFLMLFIAGTLTHACRLLLDDRARPWRSRLLWAAALVLTALFCRWAEQSAGRIQHREDLAKEQVRQREALLAEEIQNLRHPWTASAYEGIGELTLGRLKIWFAVAPRIYIDAGYEQELGPAARRQIPVRIAFFNDSFQPLSPEEAAGATPAQWSVQIRNAADSLVREWRIETASPQPLQPAERRDFHLVWDGRDGEGALVPAGDYSVAVEVHTQASHGSQTLAIAIQEAGPIEIVEPDPTAQYIESQQSATRWHQNLQEGTRLIQQLQLQQLGR
jgi:hypothetical protein